MKVFNAGDRVWHAECGIKQVEKNCPVCYGKREVTLILGNDDRVVMPCNYCAPGYESPRGYITEYEYRAEPQQITITEVEVTQTTTGEKRKYRSKCYGYDNEDLFATYDEALERCRKVKDEREKEQTTQAKYLKKSKTASYSWNAGYHLKEARRIEKTVAYHKKMAVLCKAKANTGGRAK